MKPLIIYHANCTDGFGAAYCAWLKFGDEAEYLPLDYGVKILDEVEVINRDVYILDFSFDALVTGEIIELADRVTWLDHHKTAFEAWCEEERELWIDETKYTHIVLDNNKSGTMLAWEYFNPGENAPDWVQWIDDRDRWQFKLSHSKAFHAGMASRKPWTFEQWHDIMQCGEELGAWPIVSEGHVLLVEQEAQVKSIVKYSMKCCILQPERLGEDVHRATAGEIFGVTPLEVGPDQRRVAKSINFGPIYGMSAFGLARQLGLERPRGARSVHAPWTHRVSGPNHMGYFDEAFAKGLAVNTNVHMSEVGHELANQSGSYGLVWYLGSDNMAKVSLRSNGDYDVSAIAKQFGGGGHKNAAGFSLPITTLLEWLR